MKKFNLIGLSIILSGLLISCGGGGSSSVSVLSENENESLHISPSITLLNGYYVDSAISGVSYICGSQSGITENDGKFIFELGKDCILLLIVWN